VFDSVQYCKRISYHFRSVVSENGDARRASTHRDLINAGKVEAVIVAKLDRAKLLAQNMIVFFIFRTHLMHKIGGSQ
jgi:hypothetical protein